MKSKQSQEQHWFNALLQIRQFLCESKALRARRMEWENHTQIVTVISKWGWEAGREFFFLIRKKNKTWNIKRIRLLPNMIVKMINSHSKHGLRIQRHEVYFIGLLTPSSKGRCPWGSGQFVSTKQISEESFSGTQTPRQTVAREIKGAGSSPEKAVFHSMPTKWWQVSTSLASLPFIPFILSLSIQVKWQNSQNMYETDLEMYNF